MQRYALAHQGPRVRLHGLEISKGTAWGLGIFVYAVGNGIYTVSLIFGPLSLLGGCFTTLLTFNLFFAQQLLGETLTRAKVVGALTIFGGAALSLAGSPEEIDTRFQPEQVEGLMRGGGGAYLAGLLAVLCGSSALIVWFEHSERRRPWLDGVMALVYPASLGVDEGIAHLSMRAVR